MRMILVLLLGRRRGVLRRLGAIHRLRVILMCRRRRATRTVRVLIPLRYRRWERRMIRM
jgi:hypothetical protein